MIPHEAIEKLHHYLHSLNKQASRLKPHDCYKSLLLNLEQAANEIGFMLQAKDLNDFSGLVNKLFSVQRELFKQVEDRLIHEKKIKVDLPSAQTSIDYIGQTGRLGGVKISQVTSPTSEKAHGSQIFSKPLAQNSLPIISPRLPIDQLSDKSQTKYEVEDSQRCILQEVLRQSNKLNVQIVMRRYDPKIKLCLSQSTDTGQDILDAMRGFNKDMHEDRLKEIVEENQSNIQELEKFMSHKPDFTALAPSTAADKLKQVYKSINKLTLIETQKQQPEMVGYVINEFMGYIKQSYKDIQHETYIVLMRMMDKFMRRFKAENESKTTNQSNISNSQQLKNPKDKQGSQNRGSLQKKLDEQMDRFKLDLALKSQEIEKKITEITELNSKLRLADSQFIQLQLELEQVKLMEARTEQERTMLLFEKQQLEKQLQAFVQKSYQDEAVQVSDTYMQNTIKTLQRENSEFQQKVHGLQSDLQKLSGRFYQEQKSLQQDAQLGSEQNYIDPSRIQSSRDIEYFEEDLQQGLNTDRDRQSSSSRQIPRIYADMKNLNKSPSMYAMTSKDGHRPNKSAYQEQKNMTGSVVFQHQLSNDIQNRQIPEQDEEILQSSQIVQRQRGELKHSSTKKSTALIKQTQGPQNNIEIDLTQAGTVVESYRTSSGRFIYTERTKSGKFSRVEQSASGRRIQTEGIELIDKSRQGSSKQKRSTTQKRARNDKKKPTGGIRTERAQGVTFDFVEEINSRNSSQQFVEQSPSNSPGKSSTEKDVKQLAKPQNIARQKSTPNLALKKKEYTQIHRSSTITNQPSQTSQRSIQADQAKESIKEQHSEQDQSQGQQHRPPELHSPVSMVIKVNDDDKFTAIWSPKFVAKEIQTDEQLLLSYFDTIISKLNLSKEQLTLLGNELPGLMKGQISSRDENKSIHSNESIVMKQKYSHNETTKNQSQGNNASSAQSSRLNQANNTAQPGQQTAAQQSGNASYYMSQNNRQLQRIQNKVNNNQSSQQRSKNEMEGPGSEQLQEQEEILMMRQASPEVGNYEELQAKVVERENNGKPLEMLQVKDLKQENLIQKLYTNMTQKKTKGAELALQMLKQYYKKGHHELVSYNEFKQFYSKLAAQHKQCGQNIICLHLQRFIMRLGFTCAQFSRRQLLKPSISSMKPFEQDQNTNLQIEPPKSPIQSKYSQAQYFQP